MKASSAPVAQRQRGHVPGRTLSDSTTPSTTSCSKPLYSPSRFSLGEGGGAIVSTDHALCASACSYCSVQLFAGAAPDHDDVQVVVAS